MHPQQSCGSTLCKFRGSFRDLAVPYCLQTEFLDTRIGLVKGSTIDNYLDLNKINNVQVSLSMSLQAYVLIYRVTKKWGPSLSVSHVSICVKVEWWDWKPD